MKEGDVNRKITLKEAIENAIRISNETQERLDKERTEEYIHNVNVYTKEND